MDSKIKTEDIIKTLRVCGDWKGFVRCEECDLYNEIGCAKKLMLAAADRLEELNHLMVDVDKPIRD